MPDYPRDLIADLIDGKIEIESMPGKGTTVQLRVPTGLTR